MLPIVIVPSMAIKIVFLTVQIVTTLNLSKNPLFSAIIMKQFKTKNPSMCILDCSQLIFSQYQMRVTH